MKKEIENMRDHLGPDWLHKLKLQKKSSNTATSGPRASPSYSGITDDDLYLKGETQDKNLQKVSVIPHAQDTVPSAISKQGQSKEARGTPSRSGSTNDFTNLNNGEPVAHNNQHSSAEPVSNVKSSGMNESNIVKETHNGNVTEKVVKESPQTFWKRTDSEAPTDYGKYIVMLKLMSFMVQTRILQQDSVE